jgi:nucleosome binding factor SPN SPT16 subunit
MGSFNVKNTSEKFSCLGNFKERPFTVITLNHSAVVVNYFTKIMFENRAILKVIVYYYYYNILKF